MGGGAESVDGLQLTAERLVEDGGEEGVHNSAALSDQLDKRVQPLLGINDPYLNGAIGKRQPELEEAAGMKTAPTHVCTGTRLTQNRPEVWATRVDVQNLRQYTFCR